MMTTFPKGLSKDFLVQRAYGQSARAYKTAVKDLRATEQFTQLEAAYLAQLLKYSIER